MTRDVKSKVQRVWRAHGHSLLYSAPTQCRAILALLKPQKQHACTWSSLHIWLHKARRPPVLPALTGQHSQSSKRHSTGCKRVSCIASKVKTMLATTKDCFVANQNAKNTILEYCSTHQHQAGPVRGPAVHLQSCPSCLSSPLAFVMNGCRWMTLDWPWQQAVMSS